MGIKTFIAFVSTALLFLVGVAIGYVKGFEEGYNLSPKSTSPQVAELDTEE